MPSYTYRCEECGHVFELYHSIMDDSDKYCPECEELAQRMMGAGISISSDSSSSLNESKPYIPSGFS